MQNIEKCRADFATFCTMFVPPDQRVKRYREALVEFAEFCSHKKIREYVLQNNALYVGTKMIYIPEKKLFKATRVWHEIGEFLLTVSRETVSWENLTRTVKGVGGAWHAPYISYNKTVCGLAGPQAELQMCLANGKVAQAVFKMIEIAETGPGYGPPIKTWPVASIQPEEDE